MGRVASKRIAFTQSWRGTGVVSRELILPAMAVHTLGAEVNGEPRAFHALPYCLDLLLGNGSLMR